MTTHLRLRHQAGSASLELVLLIPVLLALPLFMLFADRTGSVQQHLRNAAEQAARAASLHATPAQAHSAATATANANLTDNSVPCDTIEIAVNTNHFVRGGTVTVTLTCAIRLADLTVAGLPGQRTHTATATEIIDLHRAGT